MTFNFRRVTLSRNYRSKRQHDWGSEHIGFHWWAPGFGFGELSFIRVRGRWSCDTELTSLEFVKQALTYYMSSGCPGRKKWNRRWNKRRSSPSSLVLDILDDIDSLETDWNHLDPTYELLPTFRLRFRAHRD